MYTLFYLIYYNMMGSICTGQCNSSDIDACFEKVIASYDHEVFKLKGGKK